MTDRGNLDLAENVFNIFMNNFTIKTDNQENRYRDYCNPFCDVNRVPWLLKVKHLMFLTQTNLKFNVQYLFVSKFLNFSNK